MVGYTCIWHAVTELARESAAMYIPVETTIMWVCFGCGVLTFLFVFLSSNGFHPFLLLLRRLGEEDEPFVLGYVVHLPAVDHSQSVAMEIGCTRERGRSVRKMATKTQLELLFLYKILCIKGKPIEVH